LIDSIKTTVNQSAPEVIDTIKDDMTKEQIAERTTKVKEVFLYIKSIGEALKKREKPDQKDDPKFDKDGKELPRTEWFSKEVTEEKKLLTEQRELLTKAFTSYASENKYQELLDMFSKVKGKTNKIVS